MLPVWKSIFISPLLVLGLLPFCKLHSANAGESVGHAFFAKYCIDCHGGGEKGASTLNL